MNKKNILVTGSGGGSIGEQVVKALRNGKNTYFIVCSDTRRETIASVLGDAFCRLPMAGDKDYLSSLIACCEKFEIDVVIPGSEPELIIIAKNINLFTENGIYVPINSFDLIKLCSDKISFNDFLELNGFSFCPTFLLDRNFDYSTLKNYPYIIKPVTGSGSKNVLIVQDEKELQNIISYLGDENQFIIQQYVGTPDQEYTIGILCTPEAGYINHIILKRDLSLGLSIKQSVKNKTANKLLSDKLVVSTGISQGTFVNNELINEVVLKLMNLLSPTSTINMQCRIHNGEVFIFEINPRFSGTTNLRTLVGFNEPEFLINSHFSLPNEIISNVNWDGKTVLRGIQEYLIKRN